MNVCFHMQFVFRQGLLSQMIHPMPTKQNMLASACYK